MTCGVRQEPPLSQLPSSPNPKPTSFRPAKPQQGGPSLSPKHKPSHFKLCGLARRGASAGILIGLGRHLLPPTSYPTMPLSLFCHSFLFFCFASPAAGAVRFPRPGLGNLLLLMDPPRKGGGGCRRVGWQARKQKRTGAATVWGSALHIPYHMCMYVCVHVCNGSALSLASKRSGHMPGITSQPVVGSILPTALV